MPAPKPVVLEMLEIARREKPGLLIDLGSGDGRMVMEAANQGIPSLGIEINPFFYLFSLLKSKAINSAAKFKLGNFWTENLKEANVVTIYLPITSKRLEEKLKKELKEKSLVLTYQTGFPNWKPAKITKSGVFIYQL